MCVILGRVARSTPASSKGEGSNVKGRKRKTTVDIWRNTGFCIHRANASFSARARESALIANPGTTAAEFYANGGIVPLTNISPTYITETPPPPVGELCPQDEVHLFRSCNTADDIAFATTNLVGALEDSGEVLSMRRGARDADAGEVVKVGVEVEAGESSGAAASKVDNTLHTRGIHPVVNIRLYSRFIDPATPGFVHGNETRPCGGVRIGSLTQNGLGWKKNLKDQQRCRPDTHVVMLDTVPGTTLVEWDKKDLEHDTIGGRVDCAGVLPGTGLFSGDRSPTEPYVCAVNGDGFNFLVQHDKGPSDKKLQLQWFFGYESERDWSSECAITREQLQLAVSQLQYMERAESVAYVIANIFFVVIMISSFIQWCRNYGDDDFATEKAGRLEKFNDKLGTFNEDNVDALFREKLRKAEFEALFYGLLAIPSLVLLIYSLILIFASEIVYEERKLGMFNPMNNNTAAICTSDPGLQTAIQDIMAKVEVKQIDGPNMVLFVLSFISSLLSILKLKDFGAMCYGNDEYAWKKAQKKLKAAIDVPYGIWCYTEECLKPGKYPYLVENSRSHSMSMVVDSTTAAAVWQSKAKKRRLSNVDAPTDDLAKLTEVVEANACTICGIPFCKGKDNRSCGVKERDIICGCLCCCCISKTLARKTELPTTSEKQTPLASDDAVSKQPTATTDTFGFPRVRQEQGQEAAIHGGGSAPADGGAATKTADSDEDIDETSFGFAKEE